MENEQNTNINMFDDGLICLFDILGYKNFIKNNSWEYCANSIKTTIMELQSEATKRLLATGEDNDNEESIKFKEEEINMFLIHKLHCIIVSDTILLVFDFSNLNNIDREDFMRFIALAYISEFQKISFEKGFPMRGCIDTGSFYWYNNSYNNIFAGDVIVNCFQETENINFSGVIITDRALNKFKSKNSECTNHFIDNYIHDYIVPLKNNKEEHKNIINWRIDFSENIDLKQKIFESFHAHNKEVNSSVMEKMENTERICRFLLTK